jgi:ABC-type transport system involved in multi-copper enzyme maturation permease subunit
MLSTLFMKECRAIIKSTTYYIFLACLVIFFVTQMESNAGITKPQKGQESYGYTYSKDPQEIMEYTINLLLGEFENESYIAYPLGVYKEVHPSEKTQSKIETIIKEIVDDNGEIKDGVAYKEFEVKMGKIDDLLGGGTNYQASKLKTNAYIPMTYEEAMEEYEDILYKDKISGAYARLFCDYMGIVLAILPMFLGVTRGLRDKRAKACDVIYSKKVSSIEIVLSRYLATVIMVLIPVILLSISPSLQSLYSAAQNGIKGDGFTYIRYIIGWLLPTILISVSVSFFLTELTNGPIAILVQGLWWYISMLVGGNLLVGNVGYNIMPRFNTVGQYEVYREIFPMLVRNRLFYSGLAILLIIATIVVYHYKRKGAFMINGKIFKHRKSKLEI